MLPELTAKGRYYRVYVNGDERSKHTTEREAAEKAITYKFESPNSDVKYNHDYEVEVGAIPLETTSSIGGDVSFNIGGSGAVGGDTPEIPVEAVSTTVDKGTPTSLTGGAQEPSDSPDSLLYGRTDVEGEQIWWSSVDPNLTATMYPGGDYTIEVDAGAASGTYDATWTKPGSSPSTGTVSTVVSSVAGFTAEAGFSVSGTLADGEAITVTKSGGGFGSTGPTISIYDEVNGVDGQQIPTSSPQIGSWTQVRSAGQAPLYSGNEARFGSTSWLSGDTFGGSMDPRAFEKNFGQNLTEIFISYWWKTSVPDGSKGGGDWKMTWLMDGQEGAGDSGWDNCVPSYYTSQWGIAGNEFNLTQNNIFKSSNHNIGDSGEWVRCAYWLRDNGSGVQCEAFEQMISAVSGEHVTINNSKDGTELFPSGSGPNAYFNWWRVPGYLAQSGSAKLYYDGIYCSIGVGAPARLEVGNNATYTSCTDLWMTTATSWSDTQVQVTLRVAAGENLSGKYLHAFDSENNYVGLVGQFN